MATANLVPLPRQGRVNRRPSHPFHTRQKPWQIQPFFIAPVLPGETMKNLMWQSRVVTDPIVNPLIGWWAEYYFFYCKHRDLQNGEFDDFEQMMLDQDHDLSALYGATADVSTYFYGGTINWVRRCLDRVTAEYFRAEDDTTAHEVDGLPIAQIGQSTWLDSVINDADFVTPADVDVEGSDANTTIQASEVDVALRTWQFLRANQLTDMDYEDYLRTYGIQTARVEQNVPELVRYVRKWSYPVNTVDPTNGNPSSAVSWSIAERADKDRLFREPGFLFGVSVMRPKVYLRNQKGSATGLLTDAFSWLPAVMRDDPYTSLKKVAAASGPLASNTDAYWVDLKDLFLYGEQFVNFDLAATDAGIVALPTAGLNKRYVSSTDIDALFVDAAGGNNKIRSDGIVDVNIAGSLKDTTPPVSRAFAT